jgi:hypothetical protein
METAQSFRSRSKGRDEESSTCAVGANRFGSAAPVGAVIMHWQEAAASINAGRCHVDVLRLHRSLS